MKDQRHLLLASAATFQEVAPFNALMGGNRAADSLWTRVCVPIASAGFIVALTVSAAVVPQLRLLHFFQALIYLAIVAATRRGSAWGFGAGVTIATIWNGLNLFVTRLIQAGAGEFRVFLRTGHVSRLDTLMVAVGGAMHCLLIVACLAGFLQSHPGGKHWGQFFSGGLLVVAYMGLIVLTMAPR